MISVSQARWTLLPLQVRNLAKQRRTGNVRFFNVHYVMLTLVRTPVSDAHPDRNGKECRLNSQDRDPAARAVAPSAPSNKLSRLYSLPQKRKKKICAYIKTKNKNRQKNPTIIPIDPHWRLLWYTVVLSKWHPSKSKWSFVHLRLIISCSHSHV